ncbi:MULTISPECIES: extensin family protein [unclassified Ruegeria]|uniref:extensin-like domain-containing protein n=1 Tax=unclassified Ruegeria TaxID=2625375 RepID=UPI0014923E0F|nr:MULTISPECIES: extensin family protein [unclassified Ruegeria]NOC83641.1 extensin-like protein [Ruegeria sp. HKCCD6428]NOC91711.1 extensin-like protein [Ruegeria sp. HKCCD6604]
MKLRWGHILIGVVALSAAPVQAAPLDQSLVPLMRPLTVQQSVSAPAPSDTANLRPVSRPVSPQVTAAAARPSELPLLGPDTSLMPYLRPKSVEQQVLFKRRKLRKGSVCGDIAIQGKPVGRVGSKNSACGVKDAVQITSVSGVMLSRPSTMDCGTAIALNKWVDKTVKPTFKRRGPVVELQIAAHYACRTRNNRKGARISEHGKGRAIDISGFKMADGEVVTVLNGWRKNPSQKQLKKIWRGACGPFGTVLGPNSDRYHKDHFHLDTARYRSGPYCR